FAPAEPILEHAAHGVRLPAALDKRRCRTRSLGSLEPFIQGFERPTLEAPYASAHAENRQARRERREHRAGRPHDEQKAIGGSRSSREAKSALRPEVCLSATPGTMTGKNRSTTTTHPAAAVLGVGIVIALLALTGNVETTWAFSAFTVLVYYALTNLAALRLPQEARLYPR